MLAAKNLVREDVKQIADFFNNCSVCSKETGSGSGARKKALVLGIIRACREKETKYIVCTLVKFLCI